MKSKAVGIQFVSNENADVYDINVDVKKNIDGKIISGMVIGPTLEQNIASLLIATPGDFKLMPDLGVNLRGALLDNDLLEYRHAIKEQFAKDDLLVKHLDLYNLNNFSIDAEYEK